MVADRVFFALSDPHRRQILERLVQGGPQPTVPLLEGLGLTRQGAARHLKVLETAGLVQAHREGREIVRSLRPEALRGSLEWMNALEQEWDRALWRLAASYSSSQECADPPTEPGSPGISSA